MRWKELANFDLGRLFGGGARADDPPVYWWVRLARLFTRAVRSPLPIPASYRRIAARPAWRGPVYWNARTWRRDVVLVVEQMQSLIRCNAPLAAGLAAAAEEEQRIRTAWSPQRTTAVVRNALLAGLMFTFGISIALDPDGLGSGRAVTMAVMLVLLGGWAIWRFVLNRSSRLAVFLALEHRLSGGMSLSDAVASLPRFFPRHLADLVEAGEATGDMNRAFGQFSEAMIASLGLHRQLKLTMHYIKVVLLAQALVVGFLLVKVLPVWLEILTELHPEGPVYRPSFGAMGFLNIILPSFDTLASLPHAAASWSRPLLALLALYVCWRVLARFRGRRSWASRGLSTIVLYIPWVRAMVVRHNLGLIASMLHGLLRAGVPLDGALGQVTESELLPAYRAWLEKFRARIQQGDSAAEALARTRSRRLIPDSFAGLLEAGERTGQLPEMLEQVGLLYRGQVERQIRVMAALVLPLGVFLLGYVTLCAQTIAFGALASIFDSLIV